MDDKSALLGSLKIDRSAVDEAPGHGRRWALGIVLLLAAAAVLWFFLHGDARVAVTTVVARTTGGPAGGASVLDASGYVVARRRATVSSKLTGKVVELRIEEGSRVEQGEILARIDDANIRTQLALTRSQLDAARAQLVEGEVQLAEAERSLRRTRELAARQMLSQAALDTAQSTVDGARARLDSTRSNVAVAEKTVAVQAQQLDDTLVRAPFAGVITVKNAQPGEMISPLSAGGDGTRTGIGTLVDMDSLEVEVDVNENFINRVTAGQPAETTLNAYPDWKVPSEVIAVIPTADRSKATVKVRIALKLKDPRVLPDMGARVRFLSPPSAQGEVARPLVLVPAAAVQRGEKGGTVYLLRGETVERRAVSLGSTRGQDVEISAGLSGGETLAVGDFARLRDGAPVRLQTQE